MNDVKPDFCIIIIYGSMFLSRALSNIHAGVILIKVQDVCKLEHGAENILCGICGKLLKVALLTWQLDLKPLDTEELPNK